jgi:hypothetical protein
MTHTGSLDATHPRCERSQLTLGLYRFSQLNGKKQTRSTWEQHVSRAALGEQHHYLGIHAVAKQELLLP